MVGQTETAGASNVRYEHLPTYRAVTHLIDHLPIESGHVVSLFAVATRVLVLHRREQRKQR